MVDRASFGRCASVLVITSLLAACNPIKNSSNREYLKFPTPLDKGNNDAPTTSTANNGTDGLGLIEPNTNTSTESNSAVETWGYDQYAPNSTSSSSKKTQRFDTPVTEGGGGFVRPPISAPKFNNPNESVTFSTEKMPIVAFINEVYGKILGLSFEIDPSLESRKDGVTLRLADTVTKQELFELANGVLDRYGVSMAQEGKVLRFVINDKGGKSSTPPLLVSGRALPDMPEGHQTVFQTAPLIAISQADAINWLKRAYGSMDLQVEGDLKNNSVVLIGPQTIVKQALQALELLDQPSFRGKHSARFELAFQSPDALTKALEQVLKAQGYAVSTGTGEIINSSIVLLPLSFSNSVLVFTPNQQTLDHVARWIEQLDRQANMEPNNSKVFYYEVKNTRADSLVKVLDSLFFKGNSAGGSTATPVPVATPPTAITPESGIPTETTTQPQAALATTSIGGDGGGSRLKGRITLDEGRNAIVFQGDPREWQSVREVLQRMDKASRQVLVEVTIAEVNLTDDKAFGIEWLADTGVGELGGGGNLNGTIGTLGGLSIGGSGLLYTLESAGQTRFILNAMAKNEKVSILSTPKILVKSGESAKIDVGSEVPVITSQTKSTGSSDAEIVQEVQYRKTGVLLNVVPVIYSGNRVDLKIDQEVSQAQANSTSSISSPSIFNRSVNTSVTLKDGGSVILAGLITNATSEGEVGIPLLKDVPVLGEAFKTHSGSSERKEMLILIRPYIIDNDEQAYSLTQSQQAQMRMFGLPILGK